MASLVKRKALKSSSREDSFKKLLQGGQLWGGVGWGGVGGVKHVKRPYLASSQGVLALAFNRLPLAQQSH